MSSERVVGWLGDIAANIRDIVDYVGEADETAFAASKLMRDAVERCLERISESVNRIDRSGFRWKTWSRPFRGATSAAWATACDTPTRQSSQSAYGSS
jgi:uncharacterized protein with HEPN domain